MLLLAHQMLVGPLCEYVTTYCTLPTHWVTSYCLAKCVNFVSPQTEHVVFLQRGPEWPLFKHLVQHNIKVSIINTEQMTRYIAPQSGDEVPFPFELFLMSYVRSGKLFSIIDYNIENIKIWQTLFWDLRVKLECFIPFEIGPMITTKHKDIVFVGDPSSNYRQRILQRVKPTILVGCYGKERDQELYKHRILLNMHFGATYIIFEELRCLPCVLAKMVVVSENSKFDVKHPLYNFIIFAPYADLATKVAEVHAN